MRCVPDRAPAASSKGPEGTGKPACSASTQRKITKYPWRTRNSTVPLISFKLARLFAALGLRFLYRAEKHFAYKAARPFG